MEPLNNPESKKQEEPQTELDIQLQRLELDKSRLASDIAYRESTKAQDEKRFDFEQSKERSSFWQTVFQWALPLLFSIAAIGINSCNENRRSVQAENLQKRQYDLQQKQYDLQYNQAVSSYNEGRIELFRKMTERTTNANQIMEVYKAVFPRDSIILQNERKDTAGK